MKIIESTYDPRSEYYDLMRRESVPADELMGRRMEIGVVAVLGAAAGEAQLVPDHARVGLRRRARDRAGRAGVGVLRVARPDAGAGLRPAPGLTRALVVAAAVVLSVHLVQHVVEGIPAPEWFFGLGVFGAAGLWATAALWPRGSQGAQTAVLAILGFGLVWGGLAMHLADAIDDGLTVTHATGIVAGLLGVAMLAAAVNRWFGVARPRRPA